MRPAITPGPAGPGECGDLGQIGMPEAIRATVESVEAHPLRGGFRAARCAGRARLPEAHPPPRSPPRARPAPTQPKARHVRGLSGGLPGARPARARRAGADARHPVLRGRHRDPAGAHPRPARRHRGGGARRGHRRQGRGRPRLCAAARRAADPGGLGGRLRPSRDHRRPGADRRRPASRTASWRSAPGCGRTGRPRWSVRSMRCAPAARASS